MAKNDNLNDFLADLANAIRVKKNISGTINAQDFADEIASIVTGGGANFNKYQINQIITGDTCELEIIDYVDQTENVYFIGVNETENEQQLYFVDI